MISGWHWKNTGSTIPVAKRDFAGYVSFAGRIYVFGGNSTARTQSVQSSADGYSWTDHGNVLSYVATTCQAVVFNNRIWIVGGYSAAANTDKVMSSADGTNWTDHGAVLPAATRGHRTIVFDGKIWVLGGYTGTTYQLYTWSSSDGTNWTDHGAVLPANAPSYDSAAMVIGNKLYLFGGLNTLNVRLDTILSSTDGTSWTEEANKLPTYISAHQILAYDNKYWIVGGFNSQSHNIPSTTLWSSSDGLVWEQKGGIALPTRAHAAVVHNDLMWVMGGAPYGVSSAIIQNNSAGFERTININDGPSVSGAMWQIR